MKTIQPTKHATCDLWWLFRAAGVTRLTTANVQPFYEQQTEIIFVMRRISVRALAFLLIATVCIASYFVYIGLPELPCPEITRNAESHDAISAFKCDSSLQHDKDFSWLITRNVVHYILPDEDTTILEPSSVCGTDSVYLLVIVQSAPSHSRQRDAIRRTWGSELMSMRSDVRILFLLGLVNDTSLQSQVSAEMAQHCDIVQVQLCDAYQNLTLKTVHMLKWSQKRCSQARFIMKADDDVFISPVNLLRILENSSGDLIVGHVRKDWSPIRNRRLKWYIPVSLYSSDHLPPFVNGGSYLFSGSLLPQLYKGSLETPFVNWEDLFLTGLVAGTRLGLNLTHNRGFHFVKPMHECSYKDSVQVHGLKPEELMSVWEKVLALNANETYYHSLCDSWWVKMLVNIYRDGV